MAKSASYVAYGLEIHASFPLWPWGERSAVASASYGQVSVELGEPVPVIEPVGLRVGSAEAVLGWPGVGSFVISNGQAIVVVPAHGVTREELALVTAGPALAQLLEQRGLCVLHGSCVEVAGAAVVLLGASGSGKSTIAATLRDRGHRIISDGMTVIDCAGPEPVALPGPPHLKLWPDAIQSLAEPSAQTFPVARQEQKRWYPAGLCVARDPVPLRRIFLLEAGPRAAIAGLAPALGLLEVVRNYFLADYVDDNSAKEFVLGRCAAATSNIPVARLQRGQALNDLGAVLALLERRAGGP